MSLLVVGAAVAGALAAQPTELAVKRGERLLVLAPHPDDETLGAGGLIQRVLARGGTVRVVLVTAGDGYVEAVVHAAAWIGRFHAAAERLPGDALATLHRYDAEYYRGWSRRTLDYVEDGERRFPWLAELCRAFEERCAPALAAAPVTAIHGEFYPRNVLIRGSDVHPIDWESAALAAGEIDLVALIDGWDESHDRALSAYVDERFDGRAPDAFERRCDAARLYLGFRWLGDRPHWTNLDSSEYEFRALRATARRMELLP